MYPPTKYFTSPKYRLLHVPTKQRSGTLAIWYTVKHYVHPHMHALGRDDRTAVIGYLLLPLRFRYGAAWLTILTIILL